MEANEGASATAALEEKTVRPQEVRIAFPSVWECGGVLALWDGWIRPSNLVAEEKTPRG